MLHVSYARLAAPAESADLTRFGHKQLIDQLTDWSPCISIVLSRVPSHRRGQLNALGADGSSSPQYGGV